MKLTLNSESSKDVENDASMEGFNNTPDGLGFITSLNLINVSINSSIHIFVIDIYVYKAICSCIHIFVDLFVCLCFYISIKNSIVCVFVHIFTQFDVFHSFY